MGGRSWLLVLLLLGSQLAQAQTIRLPEHDLGGSTLAYVLLDPRSGEVLEVRDADRPMMPASTIKLLTAIAALEVLGPQKRLETRLATSGTIRGNVLEGDLVLVGGGDVELDVDDLMELALALRRRGVERLDGRFLVDDRAIPRMPAINPSQPLDAPYNAGIGALTLAFGRATMRADGRGNWWTLPPLVERGPAWRIATGLEPSGARPLPVRDVGMHTARVFADLARRSGVELPAPERGAMPEGAQTLAVIESKPLRELIEDMLLYSNNQLAETLGLLVGNALGADASTLASSAEAVAAEIRGRVETDWSGLHITNHSGLAPDARATARQLADLLRYGLEEHDLPHFLPTSGWSGSLERRLREENTALRVWAKTGSLDFASALAGYLLSEGGLRIFVIMLAEENQRAAYDAAEVPTPAMRRAADAWEGEAKALQDLLITRWLRRN